jgi:hypothetical protein
MAASPAPHAPWLALALLLLLLLLLLLAVAEAPLLGLTTAGGGCVAGCSAAARSMAWAR